MNPNSKLWLCKTNLENDYKNTLTFASKNAQRNYFIGNPEDPTSYGTSTKMYTDYTYLRIENAIKVDDFIENIDTNNYAVILNNNKYYYYFITSMDYIDETTTKIHIELDVMQTYFFDINYNNTFVEREHVADDTVGKHTIPEGLETGEYLSGDEVFIDTSTQAYKNNIIFQVVYDDSFPNIDLQYGGVFSGTIFLVFNIANAKKFIKYYDSLGQRDYIVNIFMYYGDIESAEDYYVGSTPWGQIDFKVVNPTSDEYSEIKTVIASKPNTLGSYNPRNKKLLCYPYQYMLADNHCGLTKMYRYEDFANNDITFTKKSVVSVGGSIAYYPNDYKTNTIGLLNYQEGFVSGKFPSCSWTSDGYTNWLTQKAIDTSYRNDARLTQVIASTATTALGVATGNPVIIGMGVSGMAETGSNIINDIQSDMQQKEQHQLSPIELQGFTNAGDVVYADTRCKPSLRQMYIKEEYAKIIDKYFDMYGYQVNTLKTPNINTRRYWNFLKTKGCNFTGDIPQEYMKRIKAIFDSGITFWHDPSKMFDYTQTNSILS